MPEPVVSLSGIHVAFRQGANAVEALRDVSFDVEREQLVAIVGPSGCGKTTLLRLIAGLIQPSSGRMLVHSVTPAEARRRRWISLVSQQPTLLPNRTIEQNVRLPLDLVGRRDGARVSWALEITRLIDFRHSYPHQLSGGMRHRAALARAYVTAPRLLLLDEPFSGLDELLREQLGEDFAAQQRSLRQTAILVTHSIEEAVLLADRVIVLSDRPGRVTADIVVDVTAPRNQRVRISTPYLRRVGEVRQALRRVHGPAA